MECENFFMNVVYELCIFLILILFFLQELLGIVCFLDIVYIKLVVMYCNGIFLQILVDYLFYVQKIEVGMIKFWILKVDIVVLVKQIIDFFYELVEIEGINFMVELLNELFLLWIDVEKISLVICNLLFNVFKYIFLNGKVIFKMNCIEIDGYLFCSIIILDIGKGILEELWGRIFELFIIGENIFLFFNKVGIGLCIVKNYDGFLLWYGEFGQYFWKGQYFYIIDF